MTNMEHIKPGARVLVRNRLTDGIATVERTTETQIILRNDTRYRRRDGSEMSRNAFVGSYIYDLTEEDILRITYRNAVTEAGNALSTRDLGPLAAHTLQAYKGLLLKAKIIIDSALNTQGEA